MPLNADQQIESLPSRVLTPEAMNAWIGYVELPQWLEERRREASEQLQQELAAWQIERRESFQRELEQRMARGKEDLARERTAMQAALRDGAYRAAAAMATAAAEAVRQALLDDVRASNFQALVLQRLLPQLGDLPAVTVHVPPAAARRTAAALAQLLAEPGSAVNLVVDERLGAHQCLVRGDECLFEADLDNWIGELRTALEGLARESGLAPCSGDAGVRDRDEPAINAGFVDSTLDNFDSTVEEDDLADSWEAAR